MGFIFVLATAAGCLSDGEDVVCAPSHVEPQGGVATPPHEVRITTIYDPCQTAPSDRVAPLARGDATVGGWLSVVVRAPPDAAPSNGQADSTAPGEPFERREAGSHLVVPENRSVGGYFLPLDEEGRTHFRVSDGIWLLTKVHEGFHPDDETCRPKYLGDQLNVGIVTSPLDISLAFGIICYATLIPEYPGD